MASLWRLAASLIVLLVAVLLRQPVAAQQQSDEQILCQLGCVGVYAACLHAGGSAEFCSGALTGCQYGCTAPRPD